MLKIEFSSTVYRLETAFKPHGIPVPEDVAQSLRFEGVRRLIVRVNGFEMKRALQGGEANGSYLVVGLSLLKAAGVKLGDAVAVEMSPDPDPQEIDLCDEILIVLEQDEEAKTRWDTLTLGRRRGLAYHVATAKREETRIKRALDIAHKLKTHSLNGDQNL